MMYKQKKSDNINFKHIFKLILSYIFMQINSNIYLFSNALFFFFTNFLSLTPMENYYSAFLIHRKDLGYWLNSVTWTNLYKTLVIWENWM